ncbi:thioesterase, partial [Escherichia coli]|nr:thioesterase [Escherichia coli]
MEEAKKKEILEFLNSWGDMHMGKLLDIVFTDVT